MTYQVQPHLFWRKIPWNHWVLYGQTDSQAMKKPILLSRVRCNLMYQSIVDAQFASGLYWVSESSVNNWYCAGLQLMLTSTWRAAPDFGFVAVQWQPVGNSWTCGTTIHQLETTPTHSEILDEKPSTTLRQESRNTSIVSVQYRCVATGHDCQSPRPSLWCTW